MKMKIIVLKMLEGGIIERCEEIDYNYRLEMKFPDGKRHGVLGTSLEDCFLAMADWRHHETGEYDKWFQQEIKRRETRETQDRATNSLAGAEGAFGSKHSVEAYKGKRNWSA